MAPTTECDVSRFECSTHGNLLELSTEAVRKTYPDIDRPETTVHKFLRELLIAVYLVEPEQVVSETELFGPRLAPR